MQAKNGVPADQLAARWRKSRVSNPSGCCVEVAELAGGVIAIRDSRHVRAGPDYTRAEVAAFLAGVKDGEFDDLYPGRRRHVITDSPGKRRRDGAVTR